MDRVKRLQRVNDIRAQQERSAGQNLAEARAAQADKQKLLDQLLQYRAEYKQQFADQSNRGMDVQQYRNFQRFFMQLDKAISEQRKALEQGDAKVAQSRAAWLEKRQERETLSRLQHSIQRDASYRERQEEQKQADERYTDGARKGVN